MFEVPAGEVTNGIPVTAEATIAELTSLPGVSGAGILYAQSSDPALRTCDYQLSDRPQAAALAADAEAAARSGGYLTTPVLIALVSDDPTSALDLIVTLDVQGALVGSVPGPAGGNLYTLQAIVAVMTRGGAVLDVGYGAWG